jgi:hypothetical protein
MVVISAHHREADQQHVRRLQVIGPKMQMRWEALPILHKNRRMPRGKSYDTDWRMKDSTP